MRRLNKITWIGLGINFLMIPPLVLVGVRIRGNTFFEIGPAEDITTVIVLLLAYVLSIVFVSIGTVLHWRKEKHIVFFGPVIGVSISAAAAVLFSLVVWNIEPLLYLWRIPAYAAVPYTLLYGVLIIAKYRFNQYSKEYTGE
jgi:uncharacterized membrane protein YdbT with pleckstrin-like domain